MSKRLDRKTTVSADTKGRPLFLHHGRRQIEVEEILEEWEEAGCWWRGEQARRVYCVRCADGAIYEIHHQPPAGWRLYRAYD
jgi:hypothetical protein